MAPPDIASCSWSFRVGELSAKLPGATSSMASKMGCSWPQKNGTVDSVALLVLTSINYN